MTFRILISLRRSTEETILDEVDKQVDDLSIKPNKDVASSVDKTKPEAPGFSNKTFSREEEFSKLVTSCLMTEVKFSLISMIRDIFFFRKTLFL